MVAEHRAYPGLSLEPGTEEDSFTGRLVIWHSCGSSCGSECPYNAECA